MKELQVVLEVGDQSPGAAHLCSLVPSSGCYGWHSGTLPTITDQTTHPIFFSRLGASDYPSKTSCRASDGVFPFP